jgi:hypothetical protein
MCSANRQMATNRNSTTHKYRYQHNYKFSTTLTESFPCFFLSYKANKYQGITRNERARPTLPNFFFFVLLCIFRSVNSVCYLCVNVYCTAANGCQPNFS